jgi:hypothetical protein
MRSDWPSVSADAWPVRKASCEALTPCPRLSRALLVVHPPSHSKRTCGQRQVIPIHSPHPVGSTLRGFLLPLWHRPPARFPLPSMVPPCQDFTQRPPRTSNVPPRYWYRTSGVLPSRRGPVVKDSFTTAAPAIRDLMVRYSRSCIPHTEFGIRKSGFVIVKTGNSWCGISVYRLSLDLIRAWSPYVH